MTIFNWLLVGHLIGDWLFQNDWMAKGKKQGFFAIAGLTHFIIYTLAVMVCLWLAAGRQGYPVSKFVISALIIFGSHWLIDGTDVVKFWVKTFHQTDIPMVHMMVDQTFHVLVLVVITTLVF